MGGAPFPPKEETPPGVAPETAAAAAPAEAAPAAEPPPPVATITGYVEAAFHADFNRNSIFDPPRLRAYDGPGGFVLHAAHIGLGHSFSPEASAFVSLDFGSDATVNSFNYAPSSAGGGMPADVREGYAKWTPGDFTFVAGKFVTLNGIEVIDGPLNPTITRGFLFWLAEPATHTGAKAQYTLAEGKAHIGAGLVNGWDRLYDNNNQKTILFNADVAPDPMFHAQISGSYGAEQSGDDKDRRLSVALTGALVLDSLTLNFQGLVGSEPNTVVGSTTVVGVPPAPDVVTPTIQNDMWFGIGLQPVYTMDKFSLGARLEYFNDKHGSRLAANGVPNVDKASLLNFTITPGFTPTKNFQFRAEFRVDAALSGKDATTGDDNKKIFAGANGAGKTSQMTVAIGASYMF
jgi:Putative beta-barrel porin-2, OmpL-like. bbp2